MAIVVLGIAGGKFLGDQRAVWRCQPFAQLPIHHLHERRVVPAWITVDIVNVTVVEAVRLDQGIVIGLALSPDIGGIGDDRTGRIELAHGGDHVRDHRPFPLQPRLVLPILVIEFHLVVDRPDEQRWMIAMGMDHRRHLFAPDLQQVFIGHFAAQHQPGPVAFIGDSHPRLVGGIQPGPAHRSDMRPGEPHIPGAGKIHHPQGQFPIVGTERMRKMVGAAQPYRLTIQHQPVLVDGKGAETKPGSLAIDNLAGIPDLQFQPIQIRRGWRPWLWLESRRFQVHQGFTGSRHGHRRRGRALAKQAPVRRIPDGIGQNRILRRGSPVRHLNLESRAIEARPDEQIIDPQLIGNHQADRLPDATRITGIHPVRQRPQHLRSDGH